MFKLSSHPNLRTISKSLFLNDQIDLKGKIIT